MKLTEHNRNKVTRRHNARSRPYDLRRRVLVNNFLKDQTPYSSKHGSENNEKDDDSTILDVEEPDEPQDSDISLTDESLISNQEDSASEANFDIDTDTENTSNDSINNYSPETKEFLHLVSRRLKISDNSKMVPNLPEGSRCTTRSSIRLRQQTSSSESESANLKGRRAKQKKFNERLNRRSRRSTKSSGELRPLRSYPTFDKLNEIFENNSQSVMEKLLPKHFSGKNRRRRLKRSESNGKRITTKKRLSSHFKKMFKKKNVLSEHSRSSSSSEELNEEKQEVTILINQAVLKKIPETVTNSLTSDNITPARVTRSKSLSMPKVFTNLKKPRRKSESFKTKSNIFSLNAYKSASLL